MKRASTFRAACRSALRPILRPSRAATTARNAAVEAGRSRIYQGIHFQFSNLEGRRVGRRIGLEVALTQLQFCFPRTHICVP